MRAHGDAYAADLVPAALSRARRARVPVEAFGAKVERFLHKRARTSRDACRWPRRTERRPAGRRVDLADLDLIETELLGRLRDRLLDDGDALHFAGRPLEQARSGCS